MIKLKMRKNFKEIYMKIYPADNGNIEGYHIGVLDSGLGGLSVLRTLIQTYPNNSYSYYGDSANAPYGDRAPGEMEKLAAALIGRALEDGPDALILACNTISAYKDDLIGPDVKIPVIGTIEAGSELAVKTFNDLAGSQADPHIYSGKYAANIGLMATNVTVNSHAYKNRIRSLAPDLSVEEKACPHLVPVIEKSGTDEEKYKAIDLDLCDNKVMAPVIILGCTHFPLIRDYVQNYLGPDIRLVDPAYGMAQKLATVLEKDPEAKKNMPLKADAEAKEAAYFRRLSSSGDLEILKDVAARLFKEDIEAFPYSYMGFK